MTWNWTSQFENAPIGGDFGSITSYEIRRHKEALGERVEAEHNISVADPPIITHKSGECSIVHEEVETIATTKLVVGALQFHSSILKRDSGVGLVTVSTESHLGLINVVSSETEHPDYIIPGKSTGFETLMGNVLMSGNTVTGLPTSAFDDEQQVLSRGGHLGNHATTGSKHNDGSITSLTGWPDIGANKLKLTSHSHVMTTIGWQELDFGRYASFPILSTARTGSVLMGKPADTDSDDYFGRLKVYCPENETYTLNYKRLNAS